MALFNKVLCLRQLQYLYINIRQLNKFNKLITLCKLHEDLKQNFSNVLITPNSISNETWESMRNHGVKLTNYNPEIVDSLIFEIFKRENYVDAGLNYYKFLTTNNYNCSVTVATNYLVLFELKETLTDADKAHILDVCNVIRKQYKLLPSFTTELVIKSLCRLGKWEEAIETLQQFEKHDSTLLRSAYPELIKFFMKSNKLELGYKYLILCIKKGLELRENIYSLYLNNCLEKTDLTTFSNRMDQLFSFWKNYGVIPTKEIIVECMKACNESGWSAKIATVSKSRCNVCYEMLEETLSLNDIKRLHEAIKKHVITNDAYRVSDPKELKRFEEFLMHSRPYDFVIDGLNLIKICRIWKFEEIIKDLNSKGKRILVIGKIHLRRSQKILQLQNYASFFFVNNMSKDDAFILYASFFKGPTNVISADLMRQHNFTFRDIELSVLFKRWQLRHQYVFDKKSGDLIKLHSMSPVGEFALKKNNCWHIPFKDRSTDDLTKKYTIKWACFKMHS